LWYCRARRRAVSTESDPPEVKKARVRPSGAKKARSSSASSITLSFEVPRKIE